MRLHLLAVLVLALVAVPAFAQQAPKAAAAYNDANNLVAGFPNTIIDTTPTPAGKIWVGMNASWANFPGISVETIQPTASYGIDDMFDVSFALPLVVGEAKVRGNFDSTLAVLGNLYKGDDIMPSLGLQLAGRFPTGYGFTGYSGTLTGVATKPFGALRVNGNLGWMIDGDKKNGIEQALTATAGVDYLFMPNLCGILDVTTTKPETNFGSVDRLYLIEAGARWAVTEVDTLSLGVGAGVGPSKAAPDVIVTAGYQRVL